MSLAGNYAEVMKSTDPKKVVAYMKKKGHLSLLPQVVRILEREKAEDEVVTVARAEDANRFKDAHIIIDPRIVGGFIRRAGSRLIDASYRRALVGVFKNVTKS